MKMMNLEELQSKQEEKSSGEILFEVKLPSRGKHGYPAVFTLRPLKIADVKPLIVTQIVDEIAYSRRVIEAVGRTIVKPEKFDVKDITFGDFLKLLVAHRVNSLGRMFDIVWDCYECGKSGQTVRVDLIEGLKEEELSDEYPEEPIALKSDVKFRMPRLRLFFRESIKSIDDLTDYDMVAEALIDSNIDELDLRDYREIVEFIKKWRNYGVQREVRAKCKGCSKEVEIPIPFFLFLER